jgi:crotonobetainyl-CoA:carnitine CoA-transferase CaiB-like acyl-CoA transferase
MLLDGMRVVSFCHFLQGPAAAQYLADMGAEVVKIEPPGGGYERKWSGGDAFVDGVSAFFLCAHRNQRTIAIDLKHPRGREVVDRMIAAADVVMENFRVGVIDRLGFGYERVRSLRPDIIYASASGYGPTGPMVDKPGQDLLVQAYSGLVAVTGAERPTPVGLAAVDQHGGALLALGIVAAYVKKLRTGRGTRVDCSLLNAGIDLQTEPLTSYLTMGAERSILKRQENLVSWFHQAPYGVYPVADGWIAFSINDPVKLARALGSAELEALAGVDRYAERDAYAAAVARAVAGRRLAELAPALDAEAIWWQRVQDYDDLRVDPQVRENGCFLEVRVRSGTAVLVAHPNRYDGQVPGVRHLAFAIGQHGREILAELGYPAAEIEALGASGAVALPAEGEEVAA